MFRTRIREGMGEGANFAGHLAVIHFGCGTGCSVVLVGDVSTGDVHNFPLGGEDAQGLGLEYRRDSRLLKAQWQEGDRCKAADYEWTGNGFEKLAGRDLGPAKRCWEGR
jgi:hypothetical protein